MIAAMPEPGVALEKLGFLTIGTFDGDDPRPGHEHLLAEIELAERLGFDSVWLRHRHLQYGVSSPVTLLAAASQRTSRIEFGTAVTPLGWENPLRYAEDLGTLDVLSGGRMNPGVSVGPPMHFDDVKAALYPDTADLEDFTYERVARLHRLLRGEPASTFSGVEGIESFSDHVQPHSPGLADRLWYGAASESSSRRAGEQGLNLLTSSVVRVAPDEEPDFAAIQARSIRAFRDAFGRAGHGTADTARVSQGLVVIPTDSATAEQRAKYEAYVASRTPRTSSPQGPGRLLFARDVLGTSDEIAEALYAHAGFRESREVVFALPFSFAHEDYVQILTDMATTLGPALGWSGASGATGIEAGASGATGDEAGASGATGDGSASTGA
jgi:alkanesulfonate monooxygenase SsuD/methylene tetrahydromethanopterin reductase-like flavin-dependent oxidoreductase (luciferase family)